MRIQIPTKDEQKAHFDKWRARELTLDGDEQNIRFQVRRPLAVRPPFAPPSPQAVARRQLPTRSPRSPPPLPRVDPRRLSIAVLTRNAPCGVAARGCDRATTSRS